MSKTTLNCFPYPGNKARHADWILEHIPEHECYVELFGGAAGVLFNKPRSKIEVYNDLNGDIPHFFRVLRDRGDELQEWLENVPYSREVYNEWADDYYAGERSDDDVERAGRFYYLRYASFGGKIENKSGFIVDRPTRWKSCSKSFRDKVNGLVDFKERLRGVCIECKTALDLIDVYDNPDTTFYADPPYDGTEGRYNAEGFDHRKLAEKAKEIEGKIAISYDSIPGHYGDDFSVVTKDAGFKMDNVDSTGEKDATEYLIMNYDSGREKLMSEIGQQTLQDACD